MIEIKNISKSFGNNNALIDVSATINEGEIIALIGENGAGKSTLMRIMCGYLAPSAGNVLIYGNDIEALDNTNIPFRIDLIHYDYLNPSELKL